ncbi:hypothetical protein [Nonomuraea sp. 10N515B]|uniref:hypothetical protein n=1 Tax=Nonomuraea sp. 10N515B TaxID=3457422 RepID=UPI003FCED48D
MVAKFASALLLCPAVLVMGCGPGTAIGVASSAPTPVPPAVEPTPTAPTPCPAPTPVVAYDDARDPSPIAWTSANPVSDGRGLHITWTSGVAPCIVLDRVDVDYTADTVEVTLYEGADPNVRNPVCIQIAVQKQTIVKLQEPLAGRDVVDGAPRIGPSGS